MSLTDARVGEMYVIRDIEAEDEELRAFLFSLGCYSGETVTVLSESKGSCVILVKDARYHIDRELAAAIRLQNGTI